MRQEKNKQILVDERKQIIRDFMQFLLQRNEGRFSKLLMGQLLDEGCNFPLALAKPRFYELMISGLTAELNAGAKKEFDSRSKRATSNITHDQFVDAVRFFESNLKNPEKQMALQVIESLGRIKYEWDLGKRFFTEDSEQFCVRLEAVVKQLSEGTPGGRLSAIPLSRIKRRLYLALTTSLYKYVTHRRRFQSEFGSIPEVLKAMQESHTVFCRVMAFFSTQTPYFTHLASQIFWRTLQTLNTEF
jgi:hypothetical protein